MSSVTPFADSSVTPAVRGFLHIPDTPPRDGLVLAHGAGSNCGAPLLVALAETFAAAGITVLRIDLPFRQARPRGSPFPAIAPQDRAGLARASELLSARCPGRVFLGGHSYGGRQCTMLAAEHPEVAAGLLLCSYPLHPPGRPDNLRTAHFPQLTTPALFVHGTRDPFGSIDEMNRALELLPAPHFLISVEGAGHDLKARKSAPPLAATVLAAFEERLQRNRI